MNRLFFLDLLSSIADRGREILDGSGQGGQSAHHPLPLLCERLLSRQGEATGTALACGVVEAWHLLPEEERPAFFESLAADFSADRDAVRAAAEGYLAAPGEETLQALNAVAEPRRQELLRRINMAPGGTAAVVEMREALLSLLRARPHLKPVDADFQHLLSSWFNRGFLELRRIDWDTPARILEKLIAYEAVHEIQGWDDLRRRLAPDRRCFGFFHPAMPDEPLIFVQVALVKGISGNVRDILTAPLPEGPASDADSAIFYSISNCQRGLRGISFGNFLIKQVVEELRREMPHLHNFATLSPIPGFMGWLRTQADSGSGEAARVLPLIEDGSWSADAEAREAMRPALLRLGARYLLTMKRPGVPLDPVARFHLGNGACLERLNWLGDPSAKGLRQSAGMMVNYVYRRPDIERNHEALVNEGTIAASKAVRALAAADEGSRRAKS